MSITRWSGGATYSRVLNFRRFFQPQSGVDLYADRLICGNIQYLYLSNSQKWLFGTSLKQIFKPSAQYVTVATDYSAVNAAGMYLVCTHHHCSDAALDSFPASTISILITDVTQLCHSTFLHLLLFILLLLLLLSLTFSRHSEHMPAIN